MKALVTLFKGLFALLGLVVGVAGLYLGWQEIQESRESDRQERPRIVACLDAFDYWPAPRGSDYEMEGNAAFRLVNSGEQGATVTRIEFNPAGVARNGQHLGIGMYEGVRLDRFVAGHGVEFVPNLHFLSGAVVSPEHWVDVAEYVNVQVFTATGSGPLLQCIRSNGGWACGDLGDSGALLVDTACQ